MRLPGFPTPYQDETLWSVLARFMVRTAGPEHRKLEWLGLTKTTNQSIAPSQIQRVAQVVPVGHQWQDASEKILLEHTLIPLYLAFATPDLASEKLNQIATGQSKNPAASVGATKVFAANNRPSVRFCPACMDEQLAHVGIPLLMRKHQPAFVIVCSRHQVKLKAACEACSTVADETGKWRLFSNCDCPGNEVFPELNTNATIEGWAWLSQAADHLLSEAQLPPIDRTDVLRLALQRLAHPDDGKDRLDGIVRKSLELRFGGEFLVQLENQFPAIMRPGWVRRTLSIASKTQQTNVLRALLMSATVVDRIGEIDSMCRAQPAKPAQAIARGYGSQHSVLAAHLSAEQISMALKVANGKITAAAERLGVPASSLVSAILKLEMRVPLPSRVTKRLGGMVLARCREMLKTGIPKKEIINTLSISSWTLSLIELDAPDLRRQHRSATIEKQRMLHRIALTSYLEVRPTAGIAELSQQLASAVDWLRRYDKPWLSHNVSRKASASRSIATPRRNWDSYDLHLANRIQELATSELSSPNKPHHLTVTGMITAAGARSILCRKAIAQLIPITLALARRLAEPDEAYQRRKIRWALAAYKPKSDCVSMNRLRLLSALQPKVLMQHKTFILEEANRQGLSFHCSSPFIRE